MARLLSQNGYGGASHVCGLSQMGFSAARAEKRSPWQSLTDFGEPWVPGTYVWIPGMPKTTWNHEHTHKGVQSCR